jgi:hypothetical protein
VLTALRALLAPMLDTPAEEVPAVALVIPGPRRAPEAGRLPRHCQVRSAEARVVPAEPQVMTAGPEGIAVIESMLAGAELLMTGCDEEKVW